MQNQADFGGGGFALDVVEAVVQIGSQAQAAMFRRIVAGR